MDRQQSPEQLFIDHNMASTLISYLQLLISIMDYTEALLCCHISVILNIFPAFSDYKIKMKIKKCFQFQFPVHNLELEGNCFAWSYCMNQVFVVRNFANSSDSDLIPLLTLTSCKSQTVRKHKYITENSEE